MEQAERRLGGKLKDIRDFIDDLYENGIHAKRVNALAGATLGVMTSASLAVAMIGQALAQARGLVTKHAIKQVDRLLSNQKVDVWESFAHWVPHLVGPRREIIVAMDWTEFDRDGQSTLALNLVTGHGRATPLLWLSVWKDELTDRRNDHEDACLLRLSQVLPAGVAVTILADRGFGDHKLFAFLKNLGFGYVIRFRGNIHVTDAAGETRPATEWVGKDGRARKLRDARLTAAERYPVGATVLCSINRLFGLCRKKRSILFIAATPRGIRTKDAPIPDGRGGDFGYSFHRTKLFSLNTDTNGSMNQARMGIQHSFPFVVRPRVSVDVDPFLPPFRTCFSISASDGLFRKPSQNTFGDSRVRRIAGVDENTQQTSGAAYDEIYLVALAG